MKVTHAAVFGPRTPEKRKLVEGLKQAGLKVSQPEDAAGLRKEQLVVVGPNAAPALVRAVKKAKPSALVLVAQSRGWKAGAADGVLPLPISPNDLRVRLPELAKLAKRDQSGVRGAAKKLARALKPEPRPQDGVLDPFTSFYTFNHFKEIVFVEVKRARRYGFPVSIALVAFDPLELSGGEVSRELHSQLMGGLALAIRRSLRDTDYPVQYGVDRVLLLMPHTDLPGALVVSRRICERVAKATLTHDNQVLKPTISIGVSAAAAKGGEFSFGELAARAQTALEEAMSSGGNRVQFASALDGSES